ncbi:MAG: SPOR domain-containing protein [Geminicoccaceae bacterium]
MAPLLAVFAFAVFAGIIWLAHIEAGDMTEDRRPPLVKASTAPLKRSPDDPGGSVVAELGGVGDLLRDQPAEAEERLLPRTEQPLSPADRARAELAQERLDPKRALDALVSEIDSERQSGDAAAAGVQATDPATAEPVRSVTPSTVAGSDATATTGSEPAGTETAALSQTFEATADGRYRVQLAAVREEEDAKRAWTLFQEQLGPFISGLQPFFERAETSNGIFYRVQVGPFGETTEAERLCLELKKQSASCFVVTR